MNLIYPAIFHKEDGVYWVEFPDLEGCNTYADTLPTAVLSAKEALEGYALTILESGLKLNAPSEIETMKCDEQSFTSLVECSITNNFAKSRAVKKTLTIPLWLNELAIKENINFSSTLQNALMEQLHIQN